MTKRTAERMVLLGGALLIAFSLLMPVGWIARTMTQPAPGAQDWCAHDWGPELAATHCND